MESLNLDYYYGNESEQFSFFRIPKVLFTDDHFKKMSAESKILYGMLLDRMGLSRMNGWVDKNNRVYIIYTIDEIMGNLNCGKQKAVKLMSELDSNKGIGLIEKKRQGLGKANLIYVKNFIIQNVVEKSDSVGANNTLQEVLKSKCNNTYNNNTDSNDIYHINQSKNKLDGYDAIRNRQYYYELIKKNIEYDIITVNNHRADDIDNIVNIMTDIASLPDESTIRVNSISLPVTVIRERFMMVKEAHIDYILDVLNDNPSDIKNIRAYLITTIFNAPTTISQYYKAKVNHDMKSWSL
jgi:disulfide oxidoreductase YuzD